MDNKEEQEDTTVTIKLVTAPGTNASEIGDVYSHYKGVRWGNSVDNVDCDGCGRVFLTCDDEATADFIIEELRADDRVDDFVIC